MAGPVVVVGATGAIGSAVARRLAARGMAVHLVGRDPARLGALATTLGASHAAADVLDEAALAVAAGADALRASPGSGVVLFSTVAVRSGFSNHAVISAAKGAVEGLTTALAAELAPHVRVNCIAPSLTRSGIAQPLVGNEAMAKAIAAQHPIPRLGEGDDAGALAAFLLSGDAGWITGQVFAVDGGRSTVRTKG